MQAVPNPLDQLRPNHLPDPIGIWPPALGWWLVALLAIVLLCLLCFWAIRWHQKRRYRTAGCKKAHQLQKSYLEHQDARRYATECNRLLKSVALQVFPQERVASLSGQAWRSFLSETSNNPDFLNSAGDALGDHRFDPTYEPDTSALHTLTHGWIKKHHV